uniref:Uncharacterized protein n=1 Tax=Rhizophora mucronata TaxID=61149 RepID=A0A2P2N942_RHIMU
MLRCKSPFEFLSTSI